MLDQLIIGDKSSLDDFEASLKERAISSPKKKSIKETVPFSNVTYDFSAINGEIYWEERELEYVFEIIANNPEELELKKTEFSNWVMNVMSEKISDPYEPDYFYYGSYDDMEYSDDEGVEKTTATVKFSVYPYKISNYVKVKKVALTGSADQTVNLLNSSAHRIAPSVKTDADVVIIFGGKSYALSAGDWENVFFLQVGTNALTFQSKTACNVTISFYEEVF